MEGTVKLTDLWTYSAPWTLHKLLILRSSLPEKTSYPALQLAGVRQLAFPYHQGHN